MSWDEKEPYVTMNLGWVGGEGSAYNGLVHRAGKIALRPTRPSRLGVYFRTEYLSPAVRTVDLENNGMQYESEDGVVQVLPNSAATKIEVRFYSVDTAGQPDENGVYSPQANPVSWMSIERVTDIQEAAYGLLIKRSSGSYVENRLYIPNETQWNIVRGTDAEEIQRIENTLEWDNNIKIERHIVKDGSMPVSAKETRTTYLGDHKTLVSIEHIDDPDNAARSEKYDFYFDPENPESFRKIRRHTLRDGSWTEYIYDAEGRIAERRMSHLDRSPQEPAGRVLSYSYTPADANDACAVNTNTARVVIETIGGIEVARTYRAFYVETPESSPNTTVVEIEEKATVPEAAYGAASSVRTIRRRWGEEAPEQPGAGELRTVRYPDGRLETHTWEEGFFYALSRQFVPMTNAAAPWVRHTVTHGTLSDPLGTALRTVRSVRVMERLHEQDVFRQTEVYTGSGEYEPVEWTQFDLDDIGRVVTTTRSNGSITEIVPGCCGPNSTIEADGQIEDYSYDALRRRVSITREGAPAGSGAPENPVYISTFYDAADRVTQRVTQASGMSLTNRTVYDSAGRVAQTVDEQGRITSYGYAADGLSQTVTNASGSVVETSRYRDGRSKYTKLNGEYREVYAYGVEEDGSQWTMVFSGPDGTNSPVW
ncbi:MAG: RHS repeat domain-containing protein, partial [Kiritimatiellia bacterium]|nr:RHS repeat domain-containing protein [Kiritimatiellia bacterium]